jgi:hypothetical protein
MSYDITGRNEASDTRIRLSVHLAISPWREGTATSVPTSLAINLHEAAISQDTPQIRLFVRNILTEPSKQFSNCCIGRQLCRCAVLPQQPRGRRAEHSTCLCGPSSYTRPVASHSGALRCGVDTACWDEVEVTHYCCCCGACKPSAMSGCGRSNRITHQQ